VIARADLARDRAQVAAVGAIALALGWLAGVNPLLAVAAAIGAVYVVAVLNHFLWGVVTLAALAYVEVLPASPAISPAKVAGFLLAASWLAALLTREGDQLYRAHRGLAVTIVAFFAWLCLSALWAADTSTAAFALFRYLPNLMLLPIVYAAIKTPRDLRFVALGILAGAGVAAVGGIVSPPATADPGVVAAGRAASTVGDANSLAALLLVGVAVGFGFAAGATRQLPLRVAGGSVAALSLLGIFLSLSRGGLVALVVAGIAAVAVAGRWRLRAAVSAGGVLLVALGYFALFASLPARERVTEIGGGTGRTDLWTIAGRMVKDHPLEGVGIGNFPVTSIDYLLRPGVIKQDEFVITHPKVAHNLYLQFAAEAGLVGAALFLIIVVLSLRSGLLAARRLAVDGDVEDEILLRAFIVALAGFLAASFFISPNFNNMLWLLLAIGPAATRLMGRR
jgi:O-antigen ligase